MSLVAAPVRAARLVAGRRLAIRANTRTRAALVSTGKPESATWGLHVGVYDACGRSGATNNGSVSPQCPSWQHRSHAHAGALGCAQASHTSAQLSLCPVLSVYPRHIKEGLC